MEHLHLSSPTVISSAWLPFGRSDLEALNRFVGAHKRYAAPTEFGSSGEITDLTEGTIQMDQHGIFLIPVDYAPTDFLKAYIREKMDDSKEFGLSIYKSGLTGLGIQLEEEVVSSEKIKIASGKLAYGFADYVFPVLTDMQKSLVAGIYNEREINNIRNKLHTYSLIIGKQESLASFSADKIFQNYQADIELMTDWVTFRTTLNGCHIFIGMAGCLIIGEPDQQLMQQINSLLFTQVCQKTTQRLHSHLWSLRRQLQVIRRDLQKGSYIDLKTNHQKICQINDILSLTEVFDNKLRYETSDLLSKFESSKSEENELTSYISEKFLHEKEKAENRETTILQLTSEVSVINDEMENKLELIMTKDNMQLNLVLLILTVISAFSIAEIMNFSFEQWGLVALFIVPFTLFVLIYLRKMIKEYKFSLIRRSKGKKTK